MKSFSLRYDIIIPRESLLCYLFLLLTNIYTFFLHNFIEKYENNHIIIINTKQTCGGAYAGTIPGVIYASGQFTPALNGTVDRVYAGNIPDSCIQAANAALAGETTCGGATHFRRAGGHDGQVIGAHVFW